jgi:trehalose 6-phosphate phosphatase
MKAEPLFRCLPEIETRIRESASMLLCLDFDGTLAPIVTRPDQAQLLPGAGGALRRLSLIPGMTVSVLSGRALTDVRSRVDVPGIIYGGNHGLEILGPGLLFAHPDSARAEYGIALLCERLARELTIPGAIVEPKGLTASVHYRNTPPEFHAAVRKIVEAEAAAHARWLHVRPGNMVWEIRPNIDWHKGKALRYIRDRAVPEAWPVYIGDDNTDEDAFRELERGVSIRVGRPAETAARYCVPGPPEVLSFLLWMEAAVRRIPMRPQLANPFRAWREPAETRSTS